jgi:RecB family endonuclease NucS
MYKLNRADNQLTKLTKTSFGEQGLLERFDLEKWIAASPDVLGEDLLILATEHILPSNLRIDILALDTNANVVVVELKRDWSGSDIDWQAIKYASYCSSLTVDQLCELLAKRENIDTDSARVRVGEFIGSSL